MIAGGGLVVFVVVENFVESAVAADSVPLLLINGVGVFFVEIISCELVSGSDEKGVVGPKIKFTSSVEVTEDVLIASFKMLREGRDFGVVFEGSG